MKITFIVPIANRRRGELADLDDDSATLLIPQSYAEPADEVDAEKSTKDEELEAAAVRADAEAAERARQAAVEVRIDALVARGWDYAEAYAEVHNVDPESVAPPGAGRRAGRAPGRRGDPRAGCSPAVPGVGVCAVDRRGEGDEGVPALA